MGERRTLGARRGSDLEGRKRVSTTARTWRGGRADAR